MADSDSGGVDSGGLVESAREAALAAYAPYSRFFVGCAVESVDGEVVVGANMENACYRPGICAEISALTAARQAFGLGKVKRIAVTSLALVIDSLLDVATDHGARSVGAAPRLGEKGQFSPLLGEF